MRRPIFFCLLVIRLATSVLYAQTPLPADGSFSAKGHVEYLADSSGRLGIAEVWRDSARFRPVIADVPQFGARRQAHWLCARVVNAEARQQSFTAEIDYPFLESSQFYLLTDKGQPLTRSEPLGWQTPTKSRPLTHQNPLFLFTLAPGQTAWLYVRVRGGKMRLTVPLRLHTADGFVLADRQQRLFWDSTTGALAVMLLLSLFLFMLLRDRVYGIYGLYVLATWVYLSGNEGYWLVWLDRPHYGPISAIDLPIVGMYGAMLASFWLIRTYIFPPVIHYTWLRWLYRIAIIGPFVSLGALLASAADTTLPGWPGAVIRALEPVCYMLTMLIMVSLLVYLALRRVVPPESAATGPARLYLLAVSPPILQVILGFLRERNLIADQFINREGASLTSLLEFLILIGALGYRYKLMADDRRQLARETSWQRQQLLESQLKAQQQELHAAQAQLRLQEEKERIARDLHDHVGAQLSIIAANSPGSNGTALIGDYAREAIQSLRDTVWAIDQSVLTLANFQAKLQQYLNRQQQLHPTCTYRLEVEAPVGQPLSSAQALNLFRQVQEGVHNALKYAEATEVMVHCEVTAGQLILSVSDNGIGFDASALPTNEPHYGLRNLERRATELHGQSRIQTAPGQGTRIEVIIPLTA